MYIYIYVCIYLYMYIYTHIYIYIYIYIYTYVKIHIFLCIHVCIYIYIYVHIHIFTHIHIYTYVLPDNTLWQYTWNFYKKSPTILPHMPSFSTYPLASARDSRTAHYIGDSQATHYNGHVVLFITNTPFYARDSLAADYAWGSETSQPPPQKLPCAIPWQKWRCGAAGSGSARAWVIVGGQ